MFILRFLFGLAVSLMMRGCMAWTVTRTVLYNTKTDVTRTITGEGIAPNQTILVNGLDILTSLTGSTTPACSLDCCLSLALISGAVTLDLTAIPDPVLGTITATGLTPYVTRFQNPAANANPITMTVGGTDGYAGYGAGWNLTLQPGEEAVILKQAASNITSLLKEIAFTGTGAQTINIQMAFG